MSEPQSSGLHGLPALPESAEGRALLSALLRRRSISPRRLLPPGPSREELAAMAAAAARAPDHGGLRPWRFRLVEGEARRALGEACAAALAADEPAAPPELLQREREKIADGPTLVAVLARLAEDRPGIPVSEQHASIGAAVLGFLLAAEAFGYGGIFLSGRRVARPRLRAALGLGAGEHLVGFLTLGRPDGPARAPAPVPADLLTVVATPQALSRILDGG